jgi:peroxiredoxin
MKTRAVILIAIAVAGVSVVIFFLVGRREVRKEIAVGKTAPGFVLVDEAGNKITSDQFRGKVVFLHFWATWCTPCVMEIPSINQFYRRYSRNDGIQFIFVLYQDTPGNAMQFFSKVRFSLPMAFDTNNETARAFGVTGVPETYIIDRSGILQQRIIGPTEWESKDAIDYFNDLLTK